jgi:hypothetical protein
MMSDLDRVFEDLDRVDASVSWSQVARRSPRALPENRRPSRTVAALVGVVVTLAALAVVVRPFDWLAAPSRQSSALSGGPSTPATSSAVQVQHVGATGLIVAYSATDVRFCQSTMALALTPGPPKCGSQIQAIGVDLSQLSDAVTEDAVTWGTAYLAGTFADGTLQVTDQGPPRPSLSEPKLTDPPCPSPPNGWGSGSVDGPSMRAVQAYRRKFPSDITSVAVFHPGSAATWVVTISSMEPTRTTTALAQDYPDQLCVVQSLYQLNEVRDAKSAAVALLPGNGDDRYGVTGVGLTVSADGQPVVQVDAMVDTQQLRDALSSQLPGLIAVVPWLESASG